MPVGCLEKSPAQVKCHTYWFFFNELPKWHIHALVLHNHIHTFTTICYMEKFLDFAAMVKTVKLFKVSIEILSWKPHKTEHHTVFPRWSDGRTRISTECCQASGPCEQGTCSLWGTAREIQVSSLYRHTCVIAFMFELNDDTTFSHTCTCMLCTIYMKVVWFPMHLCS